MKTWRQVGFARSNEYAAKASTLECMIARVLQINPIGPIGRRMVAQALKRS